MRPLGDVGGDPGQRAGDRLAIVAGFAQGVQRPDPAWALAGSGPFGERLLGALHPPAQHRTFEPVDLIGPCPGRAAKQRDDRCRRPLAGDDREQLEQAGAGGRHRQRHARLGRQRDAEASQGRGDQGGLPIGAANRDRDLVRIDPVGEQARDLAAEQLRLAPVAGALEQAQRSVGRDRGRIGLEQVALEMPQRRRPAALGRPGELGDGSAELVPEHAEQLGASGECLPVLERHRHRHLAGVGERPDELDLLAGQIVESVQEDRPRRPGPRLAAERGGRSRGELVIVGELAAIAERLVGFEQRDQLALVVPGVALGDGEGEAAGVEPRGLQVGQQGLQSGREPIAAGRAREPAQRCLGGRCPSEPDPLHRAQPVDGVEAHRRARPRGTAPGSWSRFRRGSRPGPAQRSRSRRSTSSLVGATRTGSRSSVSRNAASTAAPRPDPGGPASTARLTAAVPISCSRPCRLSIGRSAASFADCSADFGPTAAPASARTFCRRGCGLSSPCAPLLHRSG